MLINHVLEHFWIVFHELLNLLKLALGIAATFTILLLIKYCKNVILSCIYSWDQQVDLFKINLFLSDHLFEHRQITAEKVTIIAFICLETAIDKGLVVRWYRGCRLVRLWKFLLQVYIASGVGAFVWWSFQ